MPRYNSDGSEVTEDCNEEADNNDCEIENVDEESVLQNSVIVEHEPNEMNVGNAQQICDDCAENCSINSDVIDDTDESDISDDDDSESTDSTDLLENQDDELTKNQPIYEGAPITLAESVVSVILFVIRHKLTASAMADLLKLIYLHCIVPTHVKHTLYKFKKLIRQSRMPIICHYYCSICYTRLENKTSSCTHCDNNSEQVGYIIRVSILEQIRMLYQRSSFINNLNKRHTREKQNVNNFEDIYDGLIYKKLVENGILSESQNISLTWNTDGVALFKSSKYSIWPFYLLINELPFEERIKKENALLAGLWFGPSKPNPNLFMNCFSEELKNLYTGIDIHSPGGIIHIRGIVICGTCDLPAKALFLNMTQYNGDFGCARCKSKGINVGRSHVYPYGETINLRTSKETSQHAQEAHETGETKIGVKGPTKLSVFVYDYIRTTSVDVMHCVYLGVIKKLMCLWFAPEYKSEKWSLYKSREVTDKYLCNIRPPSFVKRYPRPLGEFNYWKAAEFKLWCLYYSIPVLFHIMEPQYFRHYTLLVYAIYVLSQTSVSSNDIEMAAMCLEHFVSKFAELYGLNKMVPNIHQLLHLSETVINFGPLRVTSLFGFENLNGVFKNFVHGTTRAETQICSAVSLVSQLELIKEKYLTQWNKAYEFCDKLAHPNKRRKLTYVSTGIFAVGKVTEVTSSLKQILNNLGINERKLQYFRRLMNNGIVYDSESSMRNIKSNSMFCKYKKTNGSEHVGKIMYFIKGDNCDCEIECNCESKTYVILKTCVTEIPFSIRILNECNIFFLTKCVSLNETLTCIEVSQLSVLCFMVEIFEKMYFIETVNNIENE